MRRSESQFADWGTWCRKSLFLRWIVRSCDGDAVSVPNSPLRTPQEPSLELTRFGGHLILDVSRGEGGPGGSSIEVSRGVPA